MRKTMSDLNLEGKHIRIFPGDSVVKYGQVDHVTAEGLLVTVTYVDRGSWASSGGWYLGTQRFLSYQKLDFYLCEASEAKSGQRPRKVRSYSSGD